MLDPSVARDVRAQEYPPSPQIDGVQRLKLNRFVEDGGSLLEIGRFTKGIPDAFPAFDLAQITFCEVEPGAIKAWHVHREQDDLWFVPPSDRLLVGLWDVREDSPTKGAKMRFVLGAGTAELVHIPHGVAHGVANLGTTPGRMLYLLNRRFSIEDTEELRLPWNAAGDGFWSITPG